MRPIRQLLATGLTAIGVVGCLGNYEAFLFADPVQGEAPLTVTFSVQHSAPFSSRCRLSYGDGTSRVFGDDEPAGCPRSLEATHTYAAPGDYEVYFEVYKPVALTEDLLADDGLTVRVTAGNASPSAVDDAARTTRGFAVTVDVLANDSDPDGDPLSVTELTVTPADTAISVTNQGDGTLIVNPGATFVGVIEVGYTVSDGKGGVATATLSVTVDPSPGAGPVTLEVVDPSNRPQDATAVAVRRGGGAWEALSVGVTGRYTFDARAGDERLELAVLCAATPNIGTIQTFAFTRNDADSLKASCADLSLTTVDLSFTWQGLDKLGVGSYAGLVHGRDGFLGGALGAAGTVNLLVSPRVQDFIVVGDVNNAFAGAEIMRDVTPTMGGNLSFSFTAASLGMTEQVGSFTTPSGFNGSFLTWWVTKGGAVLPAGSGTASGGSYFTVPNAARLAEDLYFGTAVAAKPGAQITDTHVFANPAPYTFGLPDTSVLAVPTPSRTPRFDYSGARAGASLFEASLQRLSAPAFVWQLTVTPAALDSSSGYRIPDLAAVPGFQGFALGTGDVVAWRVGEIFANLPFAQIARGLVKVGIPLLDGLAMQTASRSGAYPVP